MTSFVQATEKISSLTVEKGVLEEEQGKLLSTNVEMAIETKKLLLLQKGWTLERQELMAANQEFVEEVERYLISWKSLNELFICIF